MTLSQWVLDQYNKTYDNEAYRTLTAHFRVNTDFTQEQEIEACNLLIDACFERVGMAEIGELPSVYGGEAEFVLRTRLVKHMAQPEVNIVINLLNAYLDRFTAIEPPQPIQLSEGQIGTNGLCCTDGLETPENEIPDLSGLPLSNPYSFRTLPRDRRYSRYLPNLRFELTLGGAILARSLE